MNNSQMLKPPASRQLSIPNLGKGYSASTLLSAPNLGGKKARFASICCSLEIFIHAIASGPVITHHASHGAPSEDIVFKKLLIHREFLRSGATGVTHAIALKIG